MIAVVWPSLTVISKGLRYSSRMACSLHQTDRDKRLDSWSFRAKCLA